MAATSEQASRTLLGQIWRYGATGLANTALGYGLIMACVYGFDTGVVAANVVGYGAGWCLSYGLNKRWTFQHRGALGSTALSFLLLVAVAFAANLLVTLSLTQAGLAYPIAQILGAGTYSVAVFAGLKWMVFTND